MYYIVNSITNKGYQFTCRICNTTVFTHKTFHMVHSTLTILTYNFLPTSQSGYLNKYNLVQPRMCSTNDTYY